MEALNFLKMAPIVNWLDYFLDRQKLLGLLTQPQPNRETLYTLADQFMEQAMSGEAEESQMRKDELRMLTEKEDLDFLRHKIAEQWMCALSCVAAVDWDLKLLFETLNMLDASLARADEIARSVAAMREKMPSTVRLLQRLLAQAGDTVQIPSKECFYVSEEPIQDPAAIVLEQLPVPDFKKKDADLDKASFTAITQHALMKAHFAAGHMATAKALLLKVRDGLKSAADPRSLGPHMDLSELEFYEVALGLRPPNVPKKPVAHDIRSLCTDQGDFNPECAVIRVRSGTFSAERLLKHLKDAGKQKPFVAEMEKLYAATVDPTQKAYIRAALYFACAFTSIGDLLASSPVFKAFSWRNSASRIQVSIPSLPPNASIQSLSASGPPIWNVLTTFDLAVLKASYAEMGDRLQYPFRMTFSDVISKPVLEFRELQNYNQVLVLLGKLQQLANMNNSAKWKVFINALGAEIQLVLTRKPEVGRLLGYEAIHVEMDMWNRRLCRADDPDAFKQATQTTLGIVKSTIQNPAGTQEFLQFVSSLCSFLINNGEWELIIKSTNLKSMYADISRVLAVQVYASSAARDRVIQAIAAWDKIIHPTLQDANKRASLGSRAVNLLINKTDLLDFLVLLKEPKTVSFLLYYTATVYNVVLMAQGTHEDERHRVDKRIFVRQADVWMVKDSEANAEMIDLPYVERLLDILCTNSIEVDPVDTWWMRTRADFYFATGRYAEAGSTYAEIALSQEKEVTKGLESNVVDDTMWSKWAACCAALRFPTLAVLIGQLRRNIAPHLLKVETFLLDTPNTFDAGHAYFPMISDFSLMEFMATIYEKHGMQTYLQQLVWS
ncbi:Integrator complex subunit 8 [Aphelenchoides avenae]|nr:Integrator complex subunit 8 [Aphelenchus avenae]